MIVFNNENFLVVDKPVCVLSRPDRFQSKDRSVIRDVLIETGLLVASDPLFIVHRLDFEVSGLLLFAKNKKAQQVASKWFEERKIKKVYEALSTGTFELNELEVWQSNLVRGKKRTFEADYGKKAVTHAKCVAEKTIEQLEGKFLLWELMPLTGRSHQLRFEMYKHGVPILNDVLYSGVKHGFSGIALRAVKLVFADDAKALGLPSELTTTGVIEWLEAQLKG